MQYILDNPNSTKTVADIAYMARITECFNSKGVSDRPENICAVCGVCPSEFQTRRGQVQEEANRMEEMQTGSIRALSVYPNPVTDVLNIDSEEPIVSVKVYSSTGTLIVRTEAIIKTIDVSSLIPGIYTVVVQTEKENATFRVVKK